MAENTIRKAQVDTSVIDSVETLLSAYVPQKDAATHLTYEVLGEKRTVSNSTVSNWLNKPDAYPDHHTWMKAAEVDHPTFRKLWGGTRVFSVEVLHQFAEWLTSDAKANSRISVNYRTIKDLINMFVRINAFPKELLVDKDGKALDQQAFRETVCGELVLDRDQLDEYVLKAMNVIAETGNIKAARNVASVLGVDYIVNEYDTEETEA